MDDSSTMAIASGFVCGLLVVVGVLSGMTWGISFGFSHGTDILSYLISIGVGAIPGVLAIITYLYIHRDKSGKSSDK